MARKPDAPKPEQDESGRFVSGNIGGGRPKGSRNKLGEAFISDMLADWEQNGPETITRVREERPQDYLKVVASILPKQVDVNVKPFEEMDDDQLRRHAQRLIEELGPLAAFASGGGAGRAEDETRH